MSYTLEAYREIWPIPNWSWTRHVSLSLQCMNMGIDYCSLCCKGSSSVNRDKKTCNIWAFPFESGYGQNKQSRAVMLRPIYALWTARRRLAYILCVDMFSNSSTGWQHWDQGSLVVRGGFRSQTKMATVEEIIDTVHSLKEIQLKAAQETSLVGAAIKYSVVCLSACSDSSTFSLSDQGFPVLFSDLSTYP